MTKLAVDFGNGFSSLTDGITTATLRSRFDYSNGHLRGNTLETMEFIVKYTNDSDDLVVVGGAYSGTATYEITKPEAAKSIFPALAVKLAQQIPFGSIDLVVVDTNPDRNLKDYKKSLLGQHKVNYLLDNQPCSLSFEVASVICVQEGLGTFNHYVTHQPMTNPDGIIGIQNVGAGTMDLLLFDGEGKCIAKQSLENRGCIRFAQWISTKLRETKVIEFDKDLPEMFEALENHRLSVNLKNSFLATNNLDISKEVQRSSREYYLAGCKKMLQSLEEYKSRLERIVFTGGLANNVILQESDAPKVAKAVNPLLDNVTGVLL
ncbi:MAG: hypothetical protein F6K56_03130 [Moorea sp. SIO3G5]|nr:hypothetical protein [Moorena sp. SIO3G5]